MGRKGLEASHDEHVNVTPLIDVVMCLIIFFMLVGKLAKNEQSDKVVIPKTQFSAEELKGEQRGRLIINLTPRSTSTDPVVVEAESRLEPQVVIRGSTVDETGKELKVGNLAEFLRKERKEQPDLKVIVRADRGVVYEWIAPVLVACAQTNIKTVNFSTEKVN